MDTNPAFKFQITPHLARLAQYSAAIRKQFYEDPREYAPAKSSTKADPLIETAYTPVKGLIHKYPTRALILMTSICSAYCRFCDRKRMVGDAKKGLLAKTDIDTIIRYLASHKEIREVIFSGGDPLTNEPLLITFLKKITKLKTIKVIRIHTRMPISSPQTTRLAFLKELPRIKQPLYIGLHFNHPDELTPETIAIIKKLRRASCILYSHTVFLKDINDDVATLETLFNQLEENDIRPYYLLRCEPIIGAQHFIVDAARERRIATELRKRLSGLACPLYVIDTPNGSGKIPVPLEFWHADITTFTDFEGTRQRIK